MNDSKCPRCGGEMAPGQMRGQHRVTFYPKHAPFLSVLFSDVPVSAQMCLDCGFIELWGDPQTARRVLKRDS